MTKATNTGSSIDMLATMGSILEEGKKTGFSAVEAFGEKVETEEYERFIDHKTQQHTASTHHVSTRAFWDVGDPVGFGLSKPGPAEIKNAFAAIYSINLPAQTGNYAHLLPASVDRVDTRIYDETIETVPMDIHGFDELTGQIDEIFISPTFKDLQLKKVHYSRGLKKVYIANTAGLDAKYLRTFFNLQLSVELGNNLIDIRESSTFARDIEPFKLVSRAYNLLHSLTETPLTTARKDIFLVLSPEASAFILKEFSDYFKVKADKKFMDIPFPAILNLVDDPLMDGRVGSVPFDDEGTQSGEKYLIRKGSFSEVITDIRSAFQQGPGIRSSGNGFRTERSLFPSVRFSNLYIKPTVLSLKNLMEDAGEGILVSLLKLKYIDREGYVFSAYGYRFSGDSLMEPVHFYFRTTFLSYFLNILKISREVKFFYSVYNVGSPYILLEAKRKSPYLWAI
jgi:predicted Zn-dependent protease